MNELNWNYGNFSAMNEDFCIYNTIYLDKALINCNGLILKNKNKVIGFINLTRILSFYRKLYLSSSGLLLTDESFYFEAISTLEKFIVSERIVVISQVDFIHKQFNQLKSKNIYFFSNKATIINPIENDEKSWLMQLQKKHRYYVRKAEKIENSFCEVKDISSFNLSLLGDLFEIYAQFMKKKKASLLFNNKDEFFSFIKRNSKQVLITICYLNNEISYFNVVHTNNKIANYIMAVTTIPGMKSYASYLGVYRLYSNLFSNNFNYLNFGGVDLLKNHGVYLFKKGFSGKLVESPKYFMIGQGLIAWLTKNAIKLRLLTKSFKNV